MFNHFINKWPNSSKSLSIIIFINAKLLTKGGGRYFTLRVGKQKHGMHEKVRLSLKNNSSMRSKRRIILQNSITGRMRINIENNRLKWEKATFSLNCVSNLLLCWT